MHDEPLRYRGSTYNPATGAFQVGEGADGHPLFWQLRTPNRGVEHGLIMGTPGSGKSNVLRLVTVEAMASGLFVIWTADPTGRHNVADLWGAAADWTAATPQDTAEMLAAADRVITARLDVGGYRNPTRDKPGIAILLDECQPVLRPGSQAARDAVRIAQKGGPAGVSLTVTAPGADLTYFGGDQALRDALSATNALALGSAGDELARVRAARRS